jgi:hypothetical protein
MTKSQLEFLCLDIWNSLSLILVPEVTTSSATSGSQINQQKEKESQALSMPGDLPMMVLTRAEAKMVLTRAEAKMALIRY